MARCGPNLLNRHRGRRALSGRGPRGSARTPWASTLPPHSQRPRHRRHRRNPGSQPLHSRGGAGAFRRPNDSPAAALLAGGGAGGRLGMVLPPPSHSRLVRLVIERALPALESREDPSAGLQAGPGGALENWKDRRAQLRDAKSPPQKLSEVHADGRSPSCDPRPAPCSSGPSHGPTHCWGPAGPSTRSWRLLLGDRGKPGAVLREQLAHEGLDGGPAGGRAGLPQAGGCSPRLSCECILQIGQLVGGGLNKVEGRCTVTMVAPRQTCQTSRPQAGGFLVGLQHGDLRKDTEVIFLSVRLAAP